MSWDEGWRATHQNYRMHEFKFARHSDRSGNCMARSMNWDKARFDKFKANGVWSPCDTDMIEEPQDQAWWSDKTPEERANSRDACHRQLAQKMAQGRPPTPARPKEVISALISPGVKAFLAGSEARRLQREKKIQKLEQGPSRSKARRKAKG